MTASDAPWHGATALADRFYTLDAALHQAQWAWHPEPAQLDPDWVVERADLTAWLTRLTDAQVNELESRPELLLGAIGGFVDVANVLRPLVVVPDSHRTPIPPTQARVTDHMSERKWQQVNALLQAAPPDRGPVTDWCAGKGHLGRSVAQLFEREVTCLEVDAQLIATGTRLGERAGVLLHYRQLDLTQNAAAPRLADETHVYALHACGELHEHLLTWLPATGARRATIVPCCHHKSPRRKALSRTAAAASIVPDFRLRRLAVAELVTASGHERRTHAFERAWRFGFEALIGELSPEATAPRQLPRPSAAALRAGFQASCRDMASRAGIALPADARWAHWEQQGLARHQRVRRLELVPHAFRRAAELWLTLDRALCIAEYGWDVRIGTLCERSVTPRNLVIDARAPS